jgi:hypothetical protein
MIELANTGYERYMCSHGQSSTMKGQMSYSSIVLA